MFCAALSEIMKWSIAFPEKQRKKIQAQETEILDSLMERT